MAYYTKSSKIFLGLEGIPYEWIENRGKLKIHRMAFEYIERKKSEQEEADRLYLLYTLPRVPS